jgi:exopolysaccharide biosynthesis polyprenyl glycosylphosphotransferase
LDDDPVRLGKTYHGIKVLGEARMLKEKIKKFGINEVVFATSRIAHQNVLDLITECEALQVEFKIVPGMFELMASRVDVDAIGGIPLVAISEIGLKGFQALVKRSTDMVLSSAFIIIFSPILLTAAAAVKLDSKGPLIFAQERVGKNGKTFKMFKFRSMIEGAEEQLAELEAKSETEGHIFKIKDDPRMTRVGKFIRRFSIDELPQLFNVLIGDMSLVGPRPPLPHEVEKYTSWHRKRLRVAPGITGLWQVSGRSLLPFEDMVRLDIYYIENWSLWEDFKILCRTLPVVLLSSGAF